MIPLCDVIPAPTRPVLSGVLAICVSAATLAAGGGLPLGAAHGVSVWIFGRAVEDRLGRVRYAILAAVCALVAAAIGRPESAATLALVLAGGAAGGVTGAHLRRYPMSRILVGVPLPPWIVEAPALVLPPIWIAVHLLAGAPIRPSLAALLIGAVAVRLMSRPERDCVEWWHP